MNSTADDQLGGAGLYRCEIFDQELVESHVVGGFDRRLSLERLLGFGTEFRQALFVGRVQVRKYALCTRDIRSANCAKLSPVVRNSCRLRADGVRSTSSILVCCKSNAAVYGLRSSPSIEQLADAAHRIDELQRPGP